ncbi:hypothetical protein HK100_006291 [Physocladia obscura]|uniref:Uncharacterized protein n=1 Tax=Physocladia obscura TaxID=109957 RepID=A0AAD5TB76_9FUNG|nr:hypothetical protein HK100_006291 [Physocladia obscura]
MFCNLTPRNNYEVNQYHLQQQQQQQQEKMQQLTIAATIARRLYQQRQQHLRKEYVQEFYNQHLRFLPPLLYNNNSKSPWRVVPINKQKPQQQDCEDNWEDEEEPIAMVDILSGGAVRKIMKLRKSSTFLITDSTTVDTEMSNESESKSGEEDGQESTIDIVQEAPKNKSIDTSSVSVNLVIKNNANFDIEDTNETITQDADNANRQQDLQKSLVTLHAISPSLHAEFSTSEDKSEWQARLSNISESLEIENLPQARNVTTGYSKLKRS